MTQPDPVFVAFCAAGLWPGLGRTLAEALPESGINSPDDVNTAALATLPRVGVQRAGRLASAFIAAAPAYELVEVLVRARVDPRLAGRAVDLLGPNAPRLVRDDPWIVLQINGVAPGDADRLAVAAVPGIQRDDPRRSRALVGYVLERVARDGSTVADVDAVAAELSQYGVGDIGAAIAAACDSGRVMDIEPEMTESDAAEGKDDPPTLLGLARFVMAEDSVAESIARLLATAEPIASGKAAKPDATLDEAQLQAVRNALSSGVSILTGGPGTGKSRTVAQIVRLAERAGKSVALAAPTGRAAKRLEQLCDAPAFTLHRLLGAQPRRSASTEDGEGAVTFDGGFARGSEWPLDEDVIVVDEASMLDVELAEALLSACSDGAHLVIVGDPAQLPSIGPGRVLGDLIDSGVAPTTQLTTLYRQAEGGAIALLATAVRGGELGHVDSPDREVVIVAARGSAEAATRVAQLVTDSIPRALGIPSSGIQVVTPVHRGPAGTQALNAVLKAALNPGDGKRRFDPGDRVVATANHPEVEPNGFANGEVGTVSAVVDGAVTIDFDSGPSTVRGKALVDITHGWAITVHRAQGSEFPAVVAVIPPEAGTMLSRPLVYTALTRAQRHLSIVHAAGPALARAVRSIGERPRRTRLRELLQEHAGQ
ncbi:MAG: Exodeoxyribonuclease [Pseudonocardiales bacterium]|nr:Exodeoxyribonuclease [Pseudonocardiales bacterium]